MDLHRIAAGAVAAVNPFVLATVRSSTGYTTDDAYEQAPSYANTQAYVQVQMLSGPELRQMDLINIQGVKRKLYLEGNWSGLVRDTSKGGDLILFGANAPGDLANSTWLFAVIFESWPDWTAAGIVRQNT